MRITFVAIGLLGVLVLISSFQPTRGQDLQPDLNKRIAELEQRVATLERHLLVQPTTSAVTAAEAESRLAAAEKQFLYTKRALKKGFVTPLQLEAAKFAVQKALMELQFANAAQKTRQ